jgi:hypothetical protein
MERSVPWLSGAAGRRALAASVYVALLAVLLLAYGSELRPAIADGGGAAASELLSRLLGQRVSPANALGIADRVTLAACLLSAFVFATWLHIVRLAPRQAVVFVLLLIGAGLRLQIALQDPIAIRRWPLDDDSHYYFNIAYNLAHGSGLKHDSFNLTTGIQPLFALLITPIYLLIESKTAAVNAVLLLQTGLGLLLAIALTTLVRRVAGDLASLLALAVWAFSAYFVLIDLNGLQMAITLALAISLLANAVSVITPRPRRVRGFYDAAEWINRNVPESAIVGGFQTGIFGYYLERRFYGLDGKINIAALDAMREHRIDEYVRDQGIER